MRRSALEGEAAVIAMLAKLEPDKLTFSPEKLTETSGDGGDIQIVVAEGLQVAVPMAGMLFPLSHGPLHTLRDIFV